MSTVSRNMILNTREIGFIKIKFLKTYGYQREKGGGEGIN